jgi:lycopene beta-cyclase
MTYFGFLAVFIGIPLALMAVLTWGDARSGRQLPASLSQLPGWLLIVAHVIAAVIWTTPWDNYLVATGVWYYDPSLVSGITIGYVPIEEYMFFVLQTVLTGLWLLWLGRRVKPVSWPAPHRPLLNRAAAGVTAAIWLAAVMLFVSGWQPGTYLALEVGWLLFPVIPQMLLGAHVMWHQRRLVLGALLAPWLYLCAADFLAIGAGTWTIDPAHSTGIMIGGVLPIEEIIFFLLTNMLIVFGMVLFLGTDNEKVKAFVARKLTRKPQPTPST